MSSIHILKTCSVSQSSRIKQLSAMFDVPSLEETKFEAQGEINLDSRDWSVGLIVGPSGSGKSSLLQQLFPSQVLSNLAIEWTGKAVIDDFPQELSIETITEAMSSVGFNTIPAWLRPFSCLSNGEQFRASIARTLVSSDRMAIVDEFTSVVDRQVARIVSYAVSKYIRSQREQGKGNQRFVAASCHLDIIDWLQPDWIIQMPELQLTWRDLQHISSRPKVSCVLTKVPFAQWRRFASFHYMSQDLNKAARCFGLYVQVSEGEPHQIASFAGLLHRPHPKVRDIIGVSRVVTLPDFQGLGLAMALLCKLGGAYLAIGKRLRNYPAHPSFIRSHRRSPFWKEIKEAGLYSPKRGETSTVAGFGNRPCGVFEYQGPPLDEVQARKLLGVS